MTGRKASDAPLSNSTAGLFLNDKVQKAGVFKELPVYNLYFLAWRHPHYREIIELVIIDLDALRKLVKKLADDHFQNAPSLIGERKYEISYQHSLNIVFPPSTASTSRDGTVKRYFNPFYLEKLFDMKLVWGANYEYPGQRWQEYWREYRKKKTDKQQPLRPKRSRGKRRIEPSPNTLLAGAPTARQSDEESSDG